MSDRRSKLDKEKKGTSSLNESFGTCQSFDKTMPRASLKDSPPTQLLNHKNIIPHWVSVTSQAAYKEKSHLNTLQQPWCPLMARLKLAVIHLFLPQSAWNSECLVNLSLQLNDKSAECFSCVNMELQKKIKS